MKNTILWSALFTLISTQVHAEPQPATMPAQMATPQTQPSALPVAPAPATPEPMMSCDYKIPAQVKTVDQSLVLNWSQKAVMQTFTFDPAALDIQMQKLQPCFTEQGWIGFNTAIQKSGNIEAIKSQKLNVSSHIDGMVLVNEAKDNQWKLTLPLTVIYQNDKEKVSQLLNIDLTVTRKPSGDLGITQMIATPRGTVTTTKPAPVVNNPENTSLDTRPTDPANQPPLGKPQY